MKKVVSVFSFLLFTVVAFSQNLSTGSQAAEINLPDVKGKNISLTSLQGKVVLVDFWASWCIPCRKAIPSLRKLYGSYKSKDFEIYSISLDTDMDSWKQAVKEDRSTWLHVLDPTGNTAAAWDVNYIPNTYLLDATGKIVAVNPTEEELQKHLQELLK